MTPPRCMPYLISAFTDGICRDRRPRRSVVSSPGFRTVREAGPYKQNSSVGAGHRPARRTLKDIWYKNRRFACRTTMSLRGRRPWKTVFLKPSPWGEGGRAKARSDEVRQKPPYCYLLGKCVPPSSVFKIVPILNPPSPKGKAWVHKETLMQHTTGAARLIFFRFLV